MSVLEQKATLERLRSLEGGPLDEAGLERAFELVTSSPDGRHWRGFLSVLLLWLGLVQLLAGVVFFFAYNWAHLHRFTKLGMLFTGVLGAALGARQLGLHRLAGQGALGAATILVGPLLAVYGQAYQTGADPYELFLGWAALVMPWVILSRLPALWVLAVVLGNTALFLYFGQVAEDPGAVLVFGSAAALDGAVWLGWELGAPQQGGLAEVRWVPRLLASATLSFLAAADVTLIFTRGKIGGAYLALPATIAVVVAVFVVYRRKLDLFMLAAALGTVMVVLTTWAGRHITKAAEIFGVFLLGFLVIAEVAAAAAYLRKVGRGHESE